jgi:methylmalonyl-CoA mutase N-terminal domain/subunit
LTAQQVDNNVVRVTVQALAAVLGGTQSLHTNSRDEALALPTEASAELALRTQQVLAHETGVADVVDPLGGSYVIEAMTDRIETGVRNYLRKIDDLGGMIRAIEQGYPQREIQDSAYRHQREVESGERGIVGVNVFVNPEDTQPEVARVSANTGEEQRGRLARFKESRDAARVGSALAAVKTAAAGSENLLPHILHAVKSNATVGEISDVLRDEFGTYREQVFL